MNPADQINLQRQIKESTEEVQNQIKELYDWEKRMKEKERKAKESKQQENAPNNKYPPVRSQIDHESHKLLKENVKESQWKTKGDQFKNQGNEMLKNGEYEKAALLYTKAIKLYEKEPIYYSNRSLCYLKLQRFIEAISDCDSALKLDDKFVKAYYRRMQARENLGFIAEALQDCQTILNLDPKNAEAQQSLKKLEALVSSDKNKVSEINLPDNESEKLSNENIKENEVKIRADEFKVKGNDAMKKGAFESAVSLYTEAIKVFDKEPIYYSNRSLCFIKLEKFDEAITDCDKAIELDDKFVKAYYRRMQANECLGLAKRALEDCTKVLEIDPKNTEAKASYQRINQRIKRYDKSKVLPPLQSNEDYITPTFTKPSETLIKIEPIEKPAHLRSKKPLKRIDINEFIEAKTTANYSNIQVSDEIIDYLFNTGECGSFVKEEPKKPKLDINATPEPATKLSPTQTPATPTESVEETSNSKTKKTETYVYSTVIFLVIALILGYYFQPQQKQLPKATQSKSQISSTSSYRLPEMPPKSTAEFHANWKDLSLENKFKYLKSIEIQKLTNILGTGFESVHLTEILSILSTFYVEEKLEPQKVLREICKHENIGILALFMDGKDKDALSKVLSYVKSTQDPGELNKIQETFNISV